jgi:hypothetical protein
VQRSAVSEAQPSASPQVTAQMQAMRNGGEPLNAELRDFFEPRFGHDFSKVRIHRDARAAETSKALNARAYTLGSDVAFASGEYKPETSPGRQLLAHELTHVVQQENSSTATHPATSTFNVAPTTDPAELEADQVAREVCSGDAVPGAVQHHAVSSAHTVHRQPAAATQTQPAQAQPAQPQEDPPCGSDQQTLLKSVRKDAEAMIEKARDNLATLKGASLKEPTKEQQNALKALLRNFHIGPDAVDKHLDTISNRLRDMVSHSQGLSEYSLVCAPDSQSGACASTADAYTRHSDNALGFCPSFFQGGDFSQKDTFVHELAHATDSRVKDWAYTSQRAYGLLTTEAALVNADSYARLVTDLREVPANEERFVAFGYTKHPDQLKDCGSFTDTLTKAIAEAELANFAALRALSEENLWKARGRLLSQFSLVYWDAGECHRNDELAKRYIDLFKKADNLFTKTGFVLQCDSEKDCKTGPAHYDGKVMRICLSWDRAVSRFAYFGWPNAILQGIYAYLDGVATGEVAGAPKEYRGANGAAIASHMIAAQRTEGDLPGTGYCDPPIDRIRPDEEKSSAASAATRKRDRIAVGATGWPVSELQEKLQVLGNKNLVVNGVFDGATEKALVQFQENEKLIKPEKSGQQDAEAATAEKGVADAPTWTRLFTKLPGHHGLPRGETFKIVGWRKDDEMTMLDFDQQLQPATINFKGLDVREVDPGGGVNTCCSGFGCRKSITHGHWPVGDNNMYGPDSVGYALPQVELYQAPHNVPCAYFIPQVMVVDLPEGPYEYVRNIQFYLITGKDVACAKINDKDRQGSSLTLPSKKKGK